MLYGALTKSTRFKLMLFKMRDVSFQPTDETSPFPGRTAYWLKHITPFLCNPAMQRHWPVIGKKIDVIRSWDTEVQPERTTEPGDTPHHHVLNIYQRLNQPLNYNREAGDVDFWDGVSGTDQIVETTQFPKEDGSIKNLGSKPRKRDRIYLAVFAYNDNIKETEFTNSVDPSYDLSIKQYFVV